LHGWIVYNGNLGGKFLEHARLFEDSARRLGIDATVVANHSVLSMIAQGNSALLGVSDRPAPDFVLFWDKDLYLARALEQRGVRLYNAASAIALCEDKGRTYQTLADHGVRMPTTVLGPRIDAWSGVVDDRYYEMVEDVIGFPMVIKESFGSFGSQVYLMEDRAAMRAKIAELGARPFVFQELIASSYGRDLRLQVVGESVVAAMHRTSTQDFRANMGQGATAKPHDPTPEQTEMAVRCAQILGADFAGVDLLFGAGGEPVLCEVNANAHLLNLRECTGINAADAMLAHIAKQVAWQRER